MNKEHLENLIVALPKSGAIDMSCYADCGTPCCVLGHYAARKDLQDEFVLNTTYVSSAHTGSPVDLASPEVLTHFGVDLDESMDLFGPEGCGGARTANQARAFIRAFIDGRMP
jgi:hypothetical protein